MEREGEGTSALAPLWMRALAALMDFVLVHACTMFVVFGVITIGRGPAWRSPALICGGLAGLALYVGVSLFWLSRDGQSPGKKVYGICIRALDGGRVSLARIVWLRNAVPMLIGSVPLVGDAFAVIDHAVALKRDRRCAHDHFAGTQVVAAPQQSNRLTLRIALALPIVVSALAVLAAFGTYDGFEIQGPSNEPGMLSGDRVWTLMPFRAIGSRIEVGDVVIAIDPRDQQSIAKRVIGMPGDEVAFRDARVLINGEPLPMRDVGPCKVGSGSNQSSCRLYETQLGKHRFRFSFARWSSDLDPITVPEGSYYLLGDHLDSSNDSRNPAIGAVPFEAIQGIVWSTYWSSDAQGVIRWDRMFEPVP